MAHHVKILGFVASFALAAQASADMWQAQPADGSHGAALTLAVGPTVSYRFECAASEVIVTETGVTQLLDLKTGQKVGDDAAAVMAPGASLMALFAGKGDPEFVPAEAAKNPAGGWNLTIRLPKGDVRLKAIGKSDTISLFTTGYTIAVKQDDAARGQWRDFMKRCADGG